MAKKNKAARKSRTPKNDWQIPISRIRPVQFLTPRYYLQNAREYPIFGCWVHQGWREAGITPVIIARQQSNDKVIFCFGRKGKPFYIAGPYDDAQRVHQILDTLIRTAGEGKFDYLVTSERFAPTNLK